MTQFIKQHRATIIIAVASALLASAFVLWGDCCERRHHGRVPPPAPIIIQVRSDWSQEQISHMAAVREAGRQMAEKLKAEELPEAGASTRLTKAELVEMVRARDKEIADLKSRLRRQNETTPAVYTQK